MQVIITGATGFMGRNLSQRLNEDGHRISATGRSSAVGNGLRMKGIDFKPADLLLGPQQNGCKVIILRPRAVFGPNDNTFVPRILRMSEKKTFPLIDNCQALVDITYIENLIDLIRNCLTAQETSWNQAYNVSNGHPITIRDWFAQILDIFERPFKPKHIPLPLAEMVATLMELYQIVSGRE